MTLSLYVVQRLWFKTNLKLCKIWFDMGEYGRMSKVLGGYNVILQLSLNIYYKIAYNFSTQILKELHKSCRKEDGSDDHKKGTQLLEVYAIEIQMYTETKNNKKLKVWFLKFNLPILLLVLVFRWRFFALSTVMFLTMSFNNLDDPLVCLATISHVVTWRISHICRFLPVRALDHLRSLRRHSSADQLLQRLPRSLSLYLNLLLTWSFK